MDRISKSTRTKEQIIATALRLFAERGYEKTSMQDIASTLGMSKGGIYHHFKSKEEIIHLVRETKANRIKENFRKWMDTIEAQTAREKLTAILEKNIADEEAHAWDAAFSSQMKSADFILSIMKNSINDSAPVLAGILKEGLQDGSITTMYPDEAAEAFLLLMNIWCDPVIFEADEKRLTRRLKFVQAMMRSVGADIVSDEVIHETSALLKNLYAGDSDRNVP